MFLICSGCGYEYHSEKTKRPRWKGKREKYDVIFSLSIILQKRTKWLKSCWKRKQRRIVNLLNLWVLKKRWMSVLTLYWFGRKWRNLWKKSKKRTTKSLGEYSRTIKTLLTVTSGVAKAHGEDRSFVDFWIWFFCIRIVSDLSLSFLQGGLLCRSIDVVYRISVMSCE